MHFTMQAIGIIHSSFSKLEDVPIQVTRSQARGQVEVIPEFVDGLDGIEEFSHITLLYVFHCSDGFDLRVRPFLDDRLHGLFATRYPRRPNQLGISTVKLLARRGNLLEVDGVDMLDGTPLLDIKPYLPEFDARENVSTGWYGRRSKA